MALKQFLTCGNAACVSPADALRAARLRKQSRRARADLYYNFTLVDPATEKRVENAWGGGRGRALSRIGSGRPPKTSDHRALTTCRPLRSARVHRRACTHHGHWNTEGGDENGAPVVSMKIDEAITRAQCARRARARGHHRAQSGRKSEENAQYDRMIARARGPVPKRATPAPPYNPRRLAESCSCIRVRKPSGRQKHLARRNSG